MPKTQNAKTNPFHKPLIELFENVAQISHVASVSEKLYTAQIKQAEALIKKHKSQAELGPILGTSTSLPIAAIDESDGIMLYYSYGSIDSFDDRLIATTKECELRLYAELLCGAFEEAERFIHKCFALAKFQSRNGKVKFGGSLGRWKCKNAKLQSGTVQYFHEFAKGQSNRKLMTEFSRLPYLADDQNRQESIQWAIDQLEVYEFARHCIVHNRGVMAEKAKRLTKGQRNVLKQITRTSSLANEPRLLPSSHKARNACSHVTGLGLLLFKAVSNTFQLSDSIPELA